MRSICIVQSYHEEHPAIIAPVILSGFRKHLPRPYQGLAGFKITS